MGSVPNCQKEILTHYAIRWFKCKLKLPKKVMLPDWLNMTHALGPAYNEHFDAKKIARCKRVLVVTKLVVAGVLLVVHCSYQDAILSYGR